jgi:hypothetical protein
MDDPADGCRLKALAEIGIGAAARVGAVPEQPSGAGGDRGCAARPVRHAFDIAGVERAVIPRHPPLFTAKTVKHLMRGRASGIAVAAFMAGDNLPVGIKAVGHSLGDAVVPIDAGQLSDAVGPVTNIGLKVTNFPMIRGFFVTLCHLWE